MLAIIEQEAASAIGADNQSTSDRGKMLSYYMGEAKHELSPPDVEGRSRVVSKDTMDTIEWIMPSLMRMFASSDDVVRFQPEDQEDEQAVSDATEYCGYLFFRKNPGFRTLHDAIKNCLIQRQAAIKVYCDESSEVREERYNGVSMMEVEAIQLDPDVEVTELEQTDEDAFTVVARRKTAKKHHKVVGVPPEELRFNKDATCIEDARFVQHRSKKTLSDLISLGYDRAKLRSIPMDENSNEREEYDTDLSDAEAARRDEALREIELCETYIKVDVDGDGIAEFRKVIHAGKVVF